MPLKIKRTQDGWQSGHSWPESPGNNLGTTGKQWIFYTARIKRPYSGQQEKSGKTLSLWCWELDTGWQSRRDMPFTKDFCCVGLVAQDPLWTSLRKLRPSVMDHTLKPGKQKPVRLWKGTLYQICTAFSKLKIWWEPKSTQERSYLTIQDRH